MLVASVAGSRVDRMLAAATRAAGVPARFVTVPRSEEHTSELQSRSDLVCRLLLEKKKKKADRQSGSQPPRYGQSCRRDENAALIHNSIVPPHYHPPRADMPDRPRLPLAP